MADDDIAFYRRRAEEELALAQSGNDTNLVSFHYRLSGFYLDLVFGAPAASSNGERHVAR